MYINKRTYINGETAIKPYYYFRNKRLHVRYNVDRCIELSDTEAEKIKKDILSYPSDKQNILAEAWNFFENFVGKDIKNDGIVLADEYMKAVKEGK